jgi:VWFA-related protein
MFLKDYITSRPLSLAVALGLLLSSSGRAQQPRQTAPEQEEEVVRITSELVQTDVAVFDKQGRFVDGLRPEQFELQVNGRTQEITFFERVRAGSRSEEAQLAAAAAARAPAAGRTPEPNRAAGAESAGRLIFFFVDDLHLSPASIGRARTALQRYVEHSMNPNDQVAIVSASGQVGFLQQLTDHPAVLRAAINRLGYKGTTDAYGGKTRISEYAASQVLESGNRELYAYLIESTKIEQQMGPGSRHGDHTIAASYSAAPHLRNRLQQVQAQGRMATDGTFKSLHGLMLSASALPGRKLVFFLSDGFFLDERAAGSVKSLRAVAQAAAEAGAVVYTLNLRATNFGPGSSVDASTNDYIDHSARRAGMAFGEMSSAKEPLQILADQTGGRAIFNADDIDKEVGRAISETADYYLLAWRPDSPELREPGARLKVSVKGHPEWRVRLRAASFSFPVAESRRPKQPARTGAARETRAGETASVVEPKGAGGGPKAAETKAAGTKADDKQKVTDNRKANDDELLAALGSLHPQRGLPVALSVGYLDTSEQGTVLNVSMQLGRAAFDFDSSGEQRKALVDVAGAAIDDRGRFGSFKQLLTVTPETAGGDASRPVVWHQRLLLKPGLYQVRVALRDRATGRVGSAMQWVEIPDLSQGDFALSSIFLGEREPRAATAEREAGGPRAVAVDVDRRFARASVLRFQTYVYNAARAGGGGVQLRAQVLRGTTPLITTRTFRVPAAADSARLPFWSELSLEQLPPGHYVLQLTADDRTTSRTAVERAGFYVE